jgi:hypothetical protein
MPRPAGFLELVTQKLGDANKTLHLHLEDGKFFNGGELTVSIQKLSVDQSSVLGLDPHSQRIRLYCEGKFFRGGHEIHFKLDDFGGDEWSIQQVEAGFRQDYDHLEHAFAVYTGFPTSDLIYRNLMDVFQNV